MARLAGRTALVSGAGSGIGRAAALLFASEGEQVVIAEIDTTLGASAERQTRDAGGEAVFIRTDVTDDASVAATVAVAVKDFGKIDILFNCAGGSINEDAPLGEVDVASV